MQQQQVLMGPSPKPRLLQQQDSQGVMRPQAMNVKNEDDSPPQTPPSMKRLYNLRSSSSKSSPSPKNPKEEDKRKDSNKKPRKK